MTRKKTRFRFKPIDFLVVLVCLSVCALSIFLFWRDINSTTTRTDKDAIASISFKYKIAQRKFEDRVVWERLQQNTSLYDKDTIRTADMAEAYITFVDGTVINLYENSMLQVSYNKDSGVQLSVNGGNITVDSTRSDKQVSVEMENGTRVNLEAGSKLEATILGSGDSAEAAFTLQSGSGSIVQTDGASGTEDSEGAAGTGSERPGQNSQVIALSAGESANVNGEGQVRQGAITVTSIASDLRVLNFQEENDVPVHLEWNASEAYAESPVTVQTSRTRDFSVIENTYSETGSSSINVPAGEGTLYWRVFTEDSEDTPVEGRVRVVDVAEVTPAAPAVSSVYTYREEPPVIQFGWNGNEYADHYKIEVASSPDFSEANMIIDQDVSSERINFSQLEQGNYYWRVTPYYLVNNIGYGEPTETRSFSVVQRQAAEPPRLSSPANNARIVHKAQDFTASFIWRSEVSSADYELKIAKDENFENVVYSSSTSSKRIKTDFNAEHFDDGEYFWKVIRKESAEADSGESDVRKFTIAPYVPALNRLVFPPDNYSVEEAVIGSTNFSWRLADEYRNQNVSTVLQLSSSADFSANVTQIDTTGRTDSSNVQLGSGTYFWRIGVLDPVKADYVYTEERIINVLRELSVPVITYPAQNQVLLAEDSAVLNLKWQSVEGADYYKVSVLRADNDRPVLEYSDVQNTLQRISLPVENGPELVKYKFTVQAFTSGSDTASPRSSGSGSGAFGVRGVYKIRLNYPAENQNINGLTALHNPVVVSWQPGRDVPASSEFILRKVQRDGSVRIVERINNPGQSISLERLTEGTYQWNVKASTSEGISLSDEGYRSFVVTPVPLLDPVVLTTPENNFEMNAAYLKRNRSLTFSWQPVSGATDYSFVLYHKESDGTLRRVTGGNTASQTMFKIRDLSILDTGEFQWQVIAYSHAADGYEEQHSSVSSGSFNINIRRPGKVRTKNPGRLYGE